VRDQSLLAACLLAVVCTGLSACAKGPATGYQPGAAPLTVQTPMRFRRMHAMLKSARTEAGQRNAKALRARSPSLSNEGISLIKAVMPHDVARTDVPRYIEGRARFGDALKAWVTAVASGTDEQVIQALYALDNATRGWTDAYLGREPETSI
jgi:hypothetical protein